MAVYDPPHIVVDDCSPMTGAGAGVIDSGDDAATVIKAPLFGEAVFFPCFLSCAISSSAWVLPYSVGTVVGWRRAMLRSSSRI
jgi:hypothetical protein